MRTRKRSKFPVLPGPGDKVIIVSGPWKGQTGMYKGPEETLAGMRHLVSLDNGFGTLIQLKQMMRI